MARLGFPYLLCRNQESNWRRYCCTSLRDLYLGCVSHCSLSFNCSKENFSPISGSWSSGSTSGAASPTSPTRPPGSASASPSWVWRARARSPSLRRPGLSGSVSGTFFWGLARNVLLRLVVILAASLLGPADLLVVPANSHPLPHLILGTLVMHVWLHLDLSYRSWMLNEAVPPCRILNNIAPKRYHS